MRLAFYLPACLRVRSLEPIEITVLLSLDVLPPEWIDDSFLMNGELYVGSTVTGNTDGAASYYGNPSPDNFYTFNSSSSGTYVFSTCGSRYDTFIRVLQTHSATWTADTVTELKAADDEGESHCTYGSCSTDCCLEVIGVYLEAGYTYIVLIEGYADGSGEYYLHTRQSYEDVNEYQCGEMGVVHVSTWLLSCLLVAHSFWLLSRIARFAHNMWSIPHLWCHRWRKKEPKAIE